MNYNNKFQIVLTFVIYFAKIIITYLNFLVYIILDIKFINLNTR